MIDCHRNTLEGIEKDCSQPGWYAMYADGRPNEAVSAEVISQARLIQPFVPLEMELFPCPDGSVQWEDAQHTWCWAAPHPVCRTVTSASRWLPRGGRALAQVEVTTPFRPSCPILVRVLHLLCSVCPSLHPCLALVCFLDLLPLGLLLTPFFCFRVVINLFFFLLICSKPNPVFRKMLI